MKEIIINAETLHKRLLAMAKVLHQVCVNNKINYYMLGGTMLGAVRHKGFIPWDDDMDFGMPREDYDRFIRLVEEELPYPFEVRYYKNELNSPIHYAKLIDGSTTLIEDSYHNYVEGLYIDIFPIDGAGNGSFADYLHARRIYYYESLITNHCTTREKNDLARKLFKKYAKAHNLPRLHNRIESLMTQKSFGDSTLVANYLGYWKEKEIMSKEIFGTPKEYAFEDAIFWGASDADAYLRSLYGDYMQLPPEDKRVFKHNFYYLDMETPYKQYLLKG